MKRLASADRTSNARRISAAASSQPGLPDVLNAVPFPLLLLGPDGKVELANASAEMFLNMSQAYMVERGWEAAFPSDSPIIGLVRESRDRNQGIAAFDLLVEFVGGRHVRVDVHTGVVQDRAGWLTLSITERAVTALVDRQIGQQNVARSAIGVAAMLAHEIKNPLSGIRGAAQLLAPSLDAEGRELTGLIISEVDRVRALIDRMEGFTDTRPRPLAPENIHAVLNHVRDVAEKGFAHGLKIVEDYDPSLPMVLADRDALVQIFLNLMKNAAEASPEGGTVRLRTGFRHGFRVRRPGSAENVLLPLEVSVIDQGEGPPAHLADYLFEPFVSARTGGTGLGLAIVAKLVAEHGGLVEHERENDKTIFRVLLPVIKG